MMRNAILSFFLFGAILSASTVDVTFVNAGNPPEAGYGFYVGPYTLSVNGQNLPAMCMDDFYEVGGSWKAYQTAVNGSDFSNTYLGNQTYNVGGYNATSGTIYNAEAYLFSLITQPGADRVDIQEAAWAIMDPNTLANVFATNNTSVEYYLSAAANNALTFNSSGYVILSQANPGSSPEQEFITFGSTDSATPEPATLGLLGGAVLAASAAKLFSRRSQASA